MATYEPPPAATMPVFQPPPAVPVPGTLFTTPTPAPAASTWEPAQFASGFVALAFAVLDAKWGHVLSSQLDSAVAIGGLVLIAGKGIVGALPIGG